MRTYRNRMRTYRNRKRVAYGAGGTLMSFAACCPLCGKTVTVDTDIAVDAAGPIGANANCATHGRIQMPVMQWIANGKFQEVPA